MSKARIEASLNEKIAELKKDKQPERDLWPGIELAISKEDFSGLQHSRVERRKKYLAVAAVVMFGFIGWFTISPQFVLLTGDDLVASLSAQHEAQKHELLVKLRSQPALTENWQDQLAELDDAANAIKLALENDPNNMALLKMLQSVHQQQISIIERVHSPKWSQI
ncbi:hypothetical protein [Paraglaciecola marina]|uniref:hypothetical protein n=1 Tax=Paraglaciecola marina TaxID=2500157 RepID=UPI00105D4457|nr:hypothetical protein [Paraglaciecola marina]